MNTNNILQKDYTINQRNYQLKLPLLTEYMIPSNDPVRLLSQFVEEMDLSDLYRTYSKVKENQVSPRKLFKIILYGYMNGLYSSREIEQACNRDINFMFLLEGSKAPDHSTIARFRSIHLVPCTTRLLSESTKYLLKIKEISGDTIFIDGTKIESNANKYTFVWKKAVTKNMKRLLNRIAETALKCCELYDIKIGFNNIIKMKDVKKLLKKLYHIKKIEDIKFVSGRGKRKSNLQHIVESLENDLLKLKEDNLKIHKCGNRNSYSKTDEDATFMRMKEDSMKNGQLKPAYNLQYGVDSEYITWLTIGPQQKDTTALIPFLKDMKENLNFKYLKIVADSGYESEENYSFLEENNQIGYIKPANFELSKKQKYKKDISRLENMKYNFDGDYYICKNNKKLYAHDMVVKQSKTGYKSQKTIYICENCSHCKFKKDCIKGRNCKIPLEERTKKLETSSKFNRQRKEDLIRITSEEGCMLRMNRSIQSEGAFADVKYNMGFKRFLSRGKENVLVESVLLAIAHNVNKLHNKIQGKKTGKHLFEMKKAA